MAKRRRKRTLNKSQAIRDYAGAHPSEGPTAVATALRAQGVKVSPGFVSMVTSKVRGGRRRKRRGRPVGSGSNGLSLNSLKAAKKFIGQIGDARQAKAAIDVVAELIG